MDITEHLRPFVGDWTVHLDMPGVELPDVRATTSFRPLFDGRYLEQRAAVDLPEAPDLLAVIAPAADGRGWTQHYFDSRGVVRLYAMTFDGGEWTLRREREDFSPLSFAQRWTARFDDDERTIHGRWEKKHGDGPWELDFHLTYARVT
jgi:hypothetical protein